MSAFDINRQVKWTILKMQDIAKDAGKRPSIGPSHMICYTRWPEVSEMLDFDPQRTSVTHPGGPQRHRKMNGQQACLLVFL